MREAWSARGLGETWINKEKQKKNMNSYYKGAFRGCGKMQFQAMYKEKLDEEKEA